VGDRAEVGWRCLARIDDGNVRLISRWRKDLTTMLRDLGEPLAELVGRRVLLDGEVVALRPDGSQDFHALTGRRPTSRLVFMCFDLLHIDGCDLLRERYADGRRALERLNLRQGRWLTTPALQGEAGAALYAFTLKARGRGLLPSVWIRPTGRPVATAPG
jgi:bifunctional non-homologous end joining protein LigD